MSGVLSVLVPAVGWALLHFIWQGLLIGWGAALLLFLLRGARPQARYAVACGALLLCAVAPLAGVLTYVADAKAGANGGVFAAALPDILPSVLPYGWHGVATAVGASGAAGAAGSADAAGAHGVAVAASGFGSLASSLESLLRRQLPLVVGLWLAGAVLMSLRLAIGLKWVSERTRADHYTVNHYWQRRLSELARRFGIEEHVRLGVADSLDSPITAGCWQPIVLVPAALISGMPVELLEALLAHELAHIKRRDYLVNLIQSAIEIVLFYHPSVWALSRRIRVGREQIADDLAVQMLGQPQRLAQALSELDRFQFATTQLAHAAHGGNLMSRIKRLLRPDVEPVSWKMALPLFGLCAAGAVFYVHAAPQPEAAATAAPIAVVAEAAVVASAPAVAAPEANVDIDYDSDGQPPKVPSAPPAPPAAPAAPALRLAEVPPAAPAASAAPAAPAALAALPALPAIPAAPALPAVPATPAIPAAPLPPKGPRHVHLHDDGERTAYALVQNNVPGNYAVSSGSRSDYRRVDQLRKSVSGDFFWYREGDQAWLIRDPATIAKINDAWAEVGRIGEQMNEQGKLMDAQGKVMDALGRKMDAAGRDAGRDFERDARVQEREINALARRQEAYARAAERVAQRMDRDGASTEQREAAQREMARLHEQMEPLQKRMEELQRVLAERGQKIAAAHEPMKDIGRQMAEAGKPMAELGRRMGELGRQQAEASRAAEASTKSLIEEARKNGKAAPAPAAGAGKEA